MREDATENKIQLFVKRLGNADLIYSHGLKNLCSHTALSDLSPTPCPA